MKKISTRTFVLIGVAVALVLAFLVSPHASSSPDGLEKVASDKGIDVGITDHAMADSPLADYAVKGVDNTNLSTGLAGIVGVAVTFALGFGLFTVLKKSRRDTTESRTPSSLTTTTT
jgi:cobalt/nickel transport system permease protein